MLLHTVGWRGLFYVFGLLGLPLLALWLKAVPPQTPKPRAGGQAAEKLSAFTMMSNSATWAIIAVNFVNHWGVCLQGPAQLRPPHARLVQMVHVWFCMQRVAGGKHDRSGFQWVH